jgi:hypothetical protein
MALSLSDSETGKVTKMAKDDVRGGQAAGGHRPGPGFGRRAAGSVRNGIEQSTARLRGTFTSESLFAAAPDPCTHTRTPFHSKARKRSTDASSNAPAQHPYLPRSVFAALARDGAFRIAARARTNRSARRSAGCSPQSNTWPAFTPAVAVDRRRSSVDGGDAEWKTGALAGAAAGPGPGDTLP